MKNIVFFIVTICLITSCNDDFYTEGRLQTISAVEITSQSAVLNGKIEISTTGNKTKIVMRGFVFGTSAGNLSERINEISAVQGNFSMKIDVLLPNTKYYAKAFVKIVQNDGSSNPNEVYPKDLFYGNIIEFTTTDRNGEALNPYENDYIELNSDGIAVMKQDSKSGITWNEAKALESNGWRLPSIDELEILYNKRATIGGFSNREYWSSTIYSSSPSMLYCFVDFNDNSYMLRVNNGLGLFRVRLVRTLPFL